MMPSNDLVFDQLPTLPQVPFLEKVVANLWQHPDVAAVWLGGSLASGKGDPYSDIDLRVAVKPSQVPKWEKPDFEKFFEGQPLAHHVMRFGENALLHHLLVANGDIYDLYVQSLEHPPSPEERLVLGCRDETFRAKLLELFVRKAVLTKDATAEGIQQILEFYWLNAQKHRKALYRDLDLLLWQGLKFFQPDLLRLQYIYLTGKDCGDLRQVTIHAMTPVVQTLRDSADKRVHETVGLPTRTREEKLEAVDKLHEEVSKVGRLLANNYKFDYPNELEALVLRHWQMFKATLQTHQTD
jgi:predicted nucleotidyltransferase